MANFNKVLLMGNLTRDPELRYTQSGTAVVSFGLAVNRRYRSPQSQETVEETTFVDCEGWGRQAETFNQYMSKGRPVFLEGRLKLDRWEDKDGQKRSKMRVVMENFQFLGGGGGGGAGRGAPDRQQNQERQPERQNAGARNAGAGNAGAGAQQPGNVSDGGPPPGEDYDFDDIPF